MKQDMEKDSKDFSIVTSNKILEAVKINTTSNNFIHSGVSDFL